MIQRYTLKEMGRIWTDQARYDAWLKVEVAACRPCPSWALARGDPVCDTGARGR